MSILLEPELPLQTETQNNIGVKRKDVKKRVPPRMLEVVSTQRLSPVMQSVVLTGETLNGFPVDAYGAHIKVFLPREGQKVPVLPTLGDKGPVWPPADLRPITRTYSVRKYCPLRNELTVDFVLHGHKTPASGWAYQADVGDKIGIAGPGGPDPLLAPADWHLLAGDLTALPGISALLENLPSDARGEAFIDIAKADHQQEVPNRTNIQIHWVNREAYQSFGHAQNSCLLDSIQQHFVVPENYSLSAFIAGENSDVIAIREYLRFRYQLTKKELYAVPYWRRGQDEETYHQERHKVMDEEY